MKKILIFSHSANGHYPEYIHHLYCGIMNCHDLEAVICVPEFFKKQRQLMSWEDCDRITFDYAPDEKLSWGDGKWYKRNLRFSLVLRSFAKKHKPDHIIMIDPMICMPFLPFLVPGKVSVSGILYGIFLYRLHELSKLRKAAELVWHYILGKHKKFSRIFTLNDGAAARFFNKKYKTERFLKLPDPFLPLPDTEENFCQKYGILPEQKVFFHFGSFGKKKGTLEILKSILLLSEEEQKKYVFVFAGVVQAGIRDEFYELYSKIQITGCKILVFNEFCSYEFLGGWCRACDVILVPYLMAFNSSGCIGYAAQFNKPVIGPAYGLLGKLIKKNSLGICLEKISPETLTAAYEKMEDIFCNGDLYLSKNTVELFCNRMLDFSR